MKIVLSLTVWILSVGMAYLVGDIAFGSDISEYVSESGQAEVFIIGGLLIAAAYSCWFVLRKEQRLADIAVPVCMFLTWALARRKTLYDGGCGLLYSIAWEIRKAYGVRSVRAELEYANVNAVYELVLYVTAVAMFFSAYLIFRCGSLMLAIALSLLFASVGAALSVDVSPQGIILVAVSLMIQRYVLVHSGQRIYPVRDVIVPLAALALSLFAAACVYNAAYDKGVKSQGRLLSAVDSLEIFLTGGNGRAYASYYKIDGADVHPTDDVIDEIIRAEKPEGNLYVTERSYVTYDSGLWRNRDIGYSADSAEFLEYDSGTFSALEADVAEISDGKAEFSTEIMDGIISYVRRHMSYTTTPGGFDEDEDPVMYAMYTAHKGYCIHFASAAAIALRCACIPTRYSTGYVIPSEAWVRLEDGTYKAVILDKYSHAWAEAYDVNESSWVIVDATPLSDRAKQLGIADESAGSTGSAGNEDADAASVGNTGAAADDVMSEDARDTTSTASGEDTGAAADDIMSEDAHDTTSTASGEDTGAAADDIMSEETHDATGTAGGDAAGKDTDGASNKAQGETSDGFSVLPAACGALFALVICAAVIAIRRRALVVRRRRGFTGRNRIAAIYDISVAVNDMLEYAGTPGRISEYTDDNEYACKVPQMCDILAEQEFADFVTCVQAAVYGNVEPDDVQMRAAMDIYNKVRAYCYWSLGGVGRLKWKYVRCFD